MMATPLNNGPGNIGIADIYRVLMELQSAMSRLVTHMERIDTRNEYADRTHADFETRLRVIEATAPATHAPDIKKIGGRVEQLERFRYTMAGGLALLALIFAALGTWIFAAVTHH